MFRNGWVTVFACRVRGSPGCSLSRLALISAQIASLPTGERRVARAPFCASIRSPIADQQVLHCASALCDWRTERMLA